MVEAEMVQDEQDASVPSTAVTIRPQRALLDVDQALEDWQRYQELTKKLLTGDDYQKIGNREFKKKSAWRKYAKAFNISCARISEEIVRTEDGFPVFARVVVRATEPNGRSQEADQECHVTERCCPAAAKQPCNRRGYHEHCQAGCNGRIHFSHPGDLPATAFTRAKNRAISDLIGAGEVSADEMPDFANDDGPSQRAPSSRRSSRPDGRTPSATEADGQARHGLRQALTTRFRSDEKAAFEFVKATEPAAIKGTGINYATISGERCREIIAIIEEPSPSAEAAQEAPSA